MADDQVLTARADAARRLSLSTWQIRQFERTDPSFPRPVQISPKKIGYKTAELLKWAAERPLANTNVSTTAAATAALAAKRREAAQREAA